MNIKVSDSMATSEFQTLESKILGLDQEKLMPYYRILNTLLQNKKNLPGVIKTKQKKLGTIQDQNSQGYKLLAKEILEHQEQLELTKNFFLSNKYKKARKMLETYTPNPKKGDVEPISESMLVLLEAKAQLELQKRQKRILDEGSRLKELHQQAIKKAYPDLHKALIEKQGLLQSLEGNSEKIIGLKGKLQFEIKKIKARLRAMDTSNLVSWQETTNPKMLTEEQRLKRTEKVSAARIEQGDDGKSYTSPIVIPEQMAITEDIAKYLISLENDHDPEIYDYLNGTIIVGDNKETAEDKINWQAQSLVDFYKGTNKAKTFEVCKRKVLHEQKLIKKYQAQIQEKIAQGQFSTMNLVKADIESLGLNPNDFKYPEFKDTLIALRNQKSEEAKSMKEKGDHLDQEAKAAGMNIPSDEYLQLKNNIKTLNKVINCRASLASFIRDGLKHIPDLKARAVKTLRINLSALGYDFQAGSLSPDNLADILPVLEKEASPQAQKLVKEAITRVESIKDIQLKGQAQAVPAKQRINNNIELENIPDDYSLPQEVRDLLENPHLQTLVSVDDFRKGNFDTVMAEAIEDLDGPLSELIKKLNQERQKILGSVNQDTVTNKVTPPSKVTQMTTKKKPTD